MKVSIITAFYHGNTYMQQYVRCIAANRRHLKESDCLEVILVNDSPEDDVLLPEGAESRDIRVLSQRRNGGIHSARILGLRACSGDYVMFLDQDDLLAENAISAHLDAMERRRMQMEKEGKDFGELLPVTVSNAMLEQADGSRLLWYRSPYHKRCIGRYPVYLKVGTQIISPGQCLVPARQIPDVWKDNICKTNGADDYYLWLLLLAAKTPFFLVDEPLYFHAYTGENLSNDTKKMDASTLEFSSYLKKAPCVSGDDIRLLMRQVSYKAHFRSGGIKEKIVETMKNPDLFWANFMFKLASRTPYGFNRKKPEK